MKDRRGHAHPSFFWYDNDKDLKVCFIMAHVNYNNEATESRFCRICNGGDNRGLVPFCI